MVFLRESTRQRIVAFAHKSNGPEEVNKAWPSALITDAFGKLCTRNESPVRESVWVRFDNNALRVGRAIVSSTGLHV